MSAYPIPAFRVTLDGKDLTTKIKPRLVRLSLTENRSNEADQLDITLDDTDGLLAIPKRGVQITLQIGWAGSALVDKGSFTVDEVEHSGTPDTLTLRARSASLIDTFRKPEERSYHDTSLGAIITQVAARHGLKPGVSDALGKKPIKHLDQTHESDAAFLSRLGKQHDAVATVKNKTLIFAPAGKGKTVSGKNLPTINLVRQHGDRHRYHCAERDTYSGVKAVWHDPKKAKRKTVLAGTADNAKQLRTTYASEKDATDNAKAEWERLKRGVFAFEMDLAQGVPTLMPESPVKVSGFKKPMDETAWIATKVTHNIADNGFTTRIELEMKTAEDEAETKADTKADA